MPIFEADPDNLAVQTAIATPEAVPPQVLSVAVSSSQWDRDVVTYLETAAGDVALSESSVLSFVGGDQIRIRFSEDVLVGLNDLTVRGKNVSQYPVSSLVYDVETATAVWTLGQPIGADTVKVRLSGIVDLARHRLDGNADGRIGGTFSRQIQVLPGDVDGDGRVELSDLAR